MRKTGKNNMKIIQRWVKKLVSFKEYNQQYRGISAYCFLQKDAKGVWLGFLAADKIPEGCIPLTDEEIIKVDKYRKENHIYPRPLE